MNTPVVLNIDHLSLDRRKFDLSPDDIKQVCRFFSLGKLQHYEKEKNVSISHSNFFILATTSQGQYALKFYPSGTARTIAVEYSLNRLLIDQDFPTPLMYPGKNNRPFILCNNRLATCFSYIDGIGAWQAISHKNIFNKINTALLVLKNILSLQKTAASPLKQESLITTVNGLINTSRQTTPYDEKKIIDLSLLKACKIYQQNQKLFTRQWLHNNANLTNFILRQNTVYTLDLSHVREDYVFSDLASLVISCLFFGVPINTVKTITQDYFAQHETKENHYIVLNALVTIGLIKEYLKNIQRERSDELSTCPPELSQIYLTQLLKRKKLITTLLKKMHADPMLIV